MKRSRSVWRKACYVNHGLCIILLLAVLSVVWVSERVWAQSQSESQWEPITGSGSGAKKGDRRRESGFDSEYEPLFQKEKPPPTEKAIPEKGPQKATSSTIKGGLSPRDIASVFNGQATAASIWGAKSARFGDSLKARQETVSALRRLESVSDAGIDGDGVNIWIEYKCGVGGGLYLMRDDKLGAHGPLISSYKRRNVLQEILGLLPQHLAFAEESPTRRAAVVGNTKVLIWNAHEDLGLGRLFKESRCPIFKVRYLEGAQCSVASLDGLKNYGTIVIQAHGGQNGRRQIAFMTGEKATERSMKKYEKHLISQPHGLVVYRGFRRNRWDYFVVTNTYISGLQGTFPNSIVYLSTCFGFYLDGMAEAFLSKGAGVVYGFTGKTHLMFSYKIAHALFNDLLQSKDVNTAYQSLPQKKDDGLYEIGDNQIRENEGIGNRFKLSVRRGLGGRLKYPEEGPGCGPNETYTGSWVVVNRPDYPRIIGASVTGAQLVQAGSQVSGSMTLDIEGVVEGEQALTQGEITEGQKCEFQFGDKGKGKMWLSSGGEVIDGNFSWEGGAPLGYSFHLMRRPEPSRPR